MQNPNPKFWILKSNLFNGIWIQYTLDYFLEFEIQKQGMSR